LTTFEEEVTKFDAKKKTLEEECDKITANKKEVKAEEEDPTKAEEIDVTAIKDKQGIPDFWFKAIKNCGMIAELIKDKDSEVLTSLTHVETIKGDKELTIKMVFGPNEYFTNDVLQLKLSYGDSDEQVTKTEGTEI